MVLNYPLPFLGLNVSNSTGTVLKKCPTGIQGFDQITYGGLPQGRPTLVCGQAGCGKTLMAMEFLVRGALKYDQPGVFVSFEETAEELTQNVQSLGWDLEQLVASQKLKLTYVRIERSEQQETGLYDLEALFKRLEHAIDAIQAKRVVLDTLEVLFAGLENAAIVRAELQRLFRWLKTKQVTAIVTGERGKDRLTQHGLEEYVSDCVILLDQRVSNELTTRRLRILKYRGSKHEVNEYPFLIEDHGISVLPLSAVGLDYQVSNQRLSTGIDRLDSMLGKEGYFRGSSILISGTAGTGKSSLCAHFTDATCQQGERCLYIAFEESSHQIIRNMRSIGIDLHTSVDKGLLKFHTLRPTLYGLEMHLVKVYQLVNEFQPSLVVMDPISGLSYGGTNAQVKSFLIRLVDLLKIQQITTLFTYLTSSEGMLEHTDIGISSLMDTWLMLRSQENNGERNRLLYILKSRGMDHSQQVREFCLTPSGVKLIDVYLGTAGVVTGTARAIQEAQEKAAAFAHQVEVDRKRRQLKHKQQAFEAQIAALQAEFEAEKTEIERWIQQEELREETLQVDRAVRAHLRDADSTE
ncbi:MAG: circadian clock protein KaiC [Elainellaceae cyanobacterium]